MQRNQSFPFRPKRKNLGYKIGVWTSLNSIITLILMTGCLLQISSIFDLYLSYPKNIFIETKFKSNYKSFPALTFCTNIGEFSGQSTDDIFLDKNISEYVDNIYVLGPDYGTDPLYENFSRTVIESVGKKYFCLTFNSQINFKFIFLSNDKITFFIPSQKP